MAGRNSPSSAAPGRRQPAGARTRRAWRPRRARPSPGWSRWRRSAPSRGHACCGPCTKPSTGRPQGTSPAMPSASTPPCRPAPFGTRRPCGTPSRRPRCRWRTTCHPPRRRTRATGRTSRCSTSRPSIRRAMSSCATTSGACAGRRTGSPTSSSRSVPSRTRSPRCWPTRSCRQSSSAMASASGRDTSGRSCGTCSIAPCRSTPTRSTCGTTGRSLRGR
jgi:hypothetical protein